MTIRSNVWIWVSRPIGDGGRLCHVVVSLRCAVFVPRVRRPLFAIIRVCVDAIKRGDDELAYRSYCQMVVALKEALIPELDAPIPAY